MRKFEWANWRYPAFRTKCRQSLVWSVRWRETASFRGRELTEQEQGRVRPTKDISFLTTGVCNMDHESWIVKYKHVSRRSNARKALARWADERRVEDPEEPTQNAAMGIRTEVQPRTGTFSAVWFFVDCWVISCCRQAWNSLLFL